MFYFAVNLSTKYFLLKGFFHSESENFPWLQVKLGIEKNVSSVTIVNRKDSNGWRLKNIEVRAGIHEVEDHSLSQKIAVNPICGTFEGPGENAKVYNITCKTPIFAKYISIQIVPNVTFPNFLPKSILQINELIINEEVT